MQSRVQCLVFRSTLYLKYVGTPDNRAKIYAARVSNVADDAHRPPLHGFAAVARAASGTDRQMEERTDTAPFKYASRIRDPRNNISCTR